VGRGGLRGTLSDSGNARLNLWSRYKPLDGRAGCLVVPSHFIDTGREPSRFRGKFKDLLCGLNALLGFQKLQEVESAEFNDAVAVAH